jgi:hypothetical protein
LSRRKTCPLKERVQHLAHAVHRNPVSRMIPVNFSVGYSKRLLRSRVRARIR